MDNTFLLIEYTIYMRPGYPSFRTILFGRFFSRKLHQHHRIDSRGCESRRPIDIKLLAEILNWALSHYPRMMGSLDLLSVLHPSFSLPGASSVSRWIDHLSSAVSLYAVSFFLFSGLTPPRRSCILAAPSVAADGRPRGKKKILGP